MPRRTQLPLDAASRAWVLLAAGACLLPLLLQLPRDLATGTAVVAVLVALVSRRRPLPAWLRIGLALALVGVVFARSHFAVGRDTGCALLAAMLAAKPAETHGLRDARSLLGFALFAPFATFLLDQGPLSLLLGLAGATLALAALLRLADLESGDLRQPASPWRRFASVWRMVAIGLPLALVAFWLFPRLATPLWGVPQNTMSKPGLADEMAPGQFQDILVDDSPALRVQFFGATPGNRELYWRGPTFWDYDGRVWTQPGWLRGLPPADVRPGTPRWDYEIEYLPTDRRQLVALDLPLAAPRGSTLSQDYSLRSDEPLTGVTRWRLRSAPPAAFQAQLAPDLRRRALALPAGYNPRTVALARQWRREAGSGAGSDAAIVRRALAMIHDGFGYTLAVPLPGRNAIDEFLFDEKAGYCEQFSASFVVLMRAAGIPARVVAGYAGGYYNRIGGYWIVRRSDAHAWAEVWLPGKGWTRADPTAAVSPERVYDTLADRLPNAGGLLDGIDGLAPVLDLGDWLRRGWNDFVLGFNAARQRQLFRPLGVEEIDDGTLLGLFAAAALLALVWMLWLSARAQRESDPVLRAWRRMGARYARLGLGREAHEPASRWSARVARERPGLGPELQRLTSRFDSWRYAGGERGGRQLARALRQHKPRRHAPADAAAAHPKPTGDPS